MTQLNSPRALVAKLGFMRRRSRSSLASCLRLAILLCVAIGPAASALAQTIEDDASAAAETTVAAYPVAGLDAESIAERWRARYAGDARVKIAVDRRSQRLLAQAPPEIHAALRAELASLVPAPTPTVPDPTPGRPPRVQPEGPVSELNWAGSGAAPVSDRLRHISWQQLIQAAQSMSAARIAVTRAESGRDLIANLPSAQGNVALRINPESGQFQLRGDAKLTAAWLRAIRAIDQRSPTEMASLVPVQPGNAESVNRAIELIQKAQLRSPQKPRWSADVIGIVPTPARPLQIAQAEVEAPPAGEEGPPAAPAPGEDVGVDGSLIGPVQIEYVEGLDAIIIRGRKADVDRIMGIIDEIERLSLETELSIELVDLQHVNSQSMADLVTQLNAQSITIRLGTVTITPLIKPNSLLLIGRKEAVDATMDLVERLDQPVEPTTQFSIFQLKHLPATDAVQTLTTFFQNRGGLGPRVQVQADFRTNSLIVYASPRDLAEVQELLLKIDVADNASTSEIRVFKLRNALAEELAPVLESTLRGEGAPAAGAAGQPPGGAAGGGVSARSSTLTLTRIDGTGVQTLKSGILTEVRVAADARANSLVVTAPAESMELIAALVKQLDELPTSEAEIKVFTVVNGDASALAETLELLFGQQTQQGQGGQQGPALQSATGAGESSLVPLRFSTDLRTNSIIATGAAADLDVVEAILLRLDESDASQRKSRVYRLLNAPALDVANAVNEFLRTERQITVDVNPEAVSPFEQIEREVVVVPELVSNSLIISATPRYFEEITKLVEELDERPPMVLIQVLIAEVALDDRQELGIELGIQDSLLFDRSVITSNATTGSVITPGFNFNNNPLGSASSAASLLTRENTAGQALSNFAVGRTNSQLGYGGLVLSASSESVNILIRALQETKRLDVLSRPQVMTLNNQPAFVLVGQRVPLISQVNQTNFGVTNATTLTNVGLVLGVTPRISPDGLVVMEIDAENSKARPPRARHPDLDQCQRRSAAPTGHRYDHGANHRQWRSGQTVILGGLIRTEKSLVKRRVPYLSDVPILGDLFRFDSEVEARAELLIIMTPYIVRKAEDAELLNQIESQRMSWCLADVIDLHGDVGLSGGRLGSSQLPTQVIYPDRDPTVREYVVPGSIEEVPSGPALERGTAAPDAGGRQDAVGRPAESVAPLPESIRPEDPFGPPGPDDQTSAPTERKGFFPWSKKTREPKSSSVAGKELETRIVSPVQYLNPRAEQDSWEANQRRLPSAK